MEEQIEYSPRLKAFKVLAWQMMAVVRQAQEHSLMSVEVAQSFKEWDASKPDSPVVVVL